MEFQAELMGGGGSKNKQTSKQKHTWACPGRIPKFKHKKMYRLSDMKTMLHTKEKVNTNWEKTGD